MGNANSAKARCKKFGEADCPHLRKINGSGETINGRPADQYCFYCTATPRAKKIGHMATWSGSTPKWCPEGR